MNTKAVLAGALALAVLAVPTLAFAQSGSNRSGANVPHGGSNAPTVAFTPLTIVPPADGAVFVYQGRRLVGSLDRPGVLWLPSGRVYGVVALRRGRVLWRGHAVAAGVPIALRWPAIPTYDPRNRLPYVYPSRPVP